ncbi:LacI family transcriptional regulator [Geomonas limicola]|uniref:LacI family transcriptional regulator n=1 Tax=Geomonas limicola TaxID=2740186 RepID=A0A6V8N4D6_9BACT|nr:GntR family transcriptional regulator [Geomonas limicola]GFO67230.1 LacI family transcriptional regulator [Geomonas limicola]
MMKSPPKYLQVQTRIQEGISSGRITGQLPGERELARMYDISYMTVRKAIDNLVSAGVLYKVPTIGTFVNSGGGAGKPATRNIGFFLDDRVQDSISSPYFSLVFRALEKEAVNRGYNLIYFSDFRDLEPTKSANKIDGLVISCFPRLEYKLLELKKHFPIVLIGNGAADKSMPSVIIDNFNGIVDAMNYLWNLGHVRIGFIAGLLDSAVGKDRLQGYLSSLNNYGIAEDRDLIYEGDYSYESGARGVESMLSLSSPPTAIVCANDSMAIGAVKAVHEKGLEVPRDVSIVGFDDITVASQIYPPLTTVAAPINELAANSIRILVSLIDGGAPEHRHLALSARLVVRESCAPRPSPAGEQPPPSPKP